MNPFTHTPEPWACYGPEHPDEHWEIDDPFGHTATVYGEPDGTGAANARRIVACVNGCARIQDPETTVPRLVKTLKEVVKNLGGARPGSDVEELLNLINIARNDNP